MKNRLTIGGPGDGPRIERVVSAIQSHIGDTGTAEVYAGPIPDNCNAELTRANRLVATALVQYAPATLGGMAFALIPTSDWAVDLQPTFVRFYNVTAELVMQCHAAELDLSELFPKKA